MTLPDKHPLCEPIKKCTNHMVKKHQSPLYNIISILDANPKNIGTKATTMHNPEGPTKKPFKIRIPPDKESFKREAQVANEEIQVFTDRSIIDNKVGVVAILTRPGKNHQILHYYLGKASEYTIYDAELVGISMVIHLIKTKVKAHCHTIIGADSQAAINAIQNELSTSSYYIANLSLCTAKQISNQRGNKKYSLTLRWIVGHMGVDRNELVDREAKKAAKGQSSDPLSLPHHLHQKLKICTTALKQNHNKQTAMKWRNNWANSAREKQDHKIDDSSPSKQFLELISNPKLFRQAASIISQMCITHILLNRYLY